jgi:CRISPR-associated protein Cas6
MEALPPPDMIDAVFPLSGSGLPREHGPALAAAVLRRLPWLADSPEAGVHAVKVSTGPGPRAWLSGRSRLSLRIPRLRLDLAQALAGAELTLEGETLRVSGPALLRELLPHNTLYARVVAGEGEELRFLEAVAAELRAMDVDCRRICGRQQAIGTVDGAARVGFSLMLDGLSAAHAQRVLARGLGPHRLWGCGLFVPHKSAAAVGS